ncbi:YkvA family protein [Filimonas effusa]|uniref:DUF1232 domain-containing protein n=1 Tax=Filimonas effusa TaxID=2508721 RepID=A0A4Q1CZD5_9BACT|nr:YkvA family protein [Filimonas effusa]RXK80767.1 DUF1232 domain-containing protein [Filimonas effusa]
MGVGGIIGRRWRIFKQESLILFYAVQQRDTPVLPKLLIGITLLYLVSPVDAIPDVIPFFGYIDDLLIVPFLMNASFRLLPGHIREAGALQARRQKRRITRLFIIFLIVILLAMTGIFILAWKITGYVMDSW